MSMDEIVEGLKKLKLEFIGFAVETLRRELLKLCDIDARNIADLALQIVDELLRFAESGSRELPGYSKRYIREKAEAILRFVG